MTYRTSFAQNREDIIIEAFFPDVKKGFYVDVGANHPLFHSVTKLFYDKGWSGINYEPNQKLYSQLVKHRKKDINIKAAVGEKNGKSEIRIFHSRDGLEGISTLSDSMVEEYKTYGSADTLNYEDEAVTVVSLKDDLKRQKVDHIHFMKIDVEGYEYAVIKGNDWGKFRPELICVEANHIRQDWRGILNNAQYKLVFNDGLNEYYLAEESAGRANYFNYADVFLGSTPVLPFLVTEDLRVLRLQLDSASDKNVMFQEQIETLKRSNETLRSELNEIITLRKHLKRQAVRYVKKRPIALGFWRRKK